MGICGVYCAVIFCEEQIPATGVDGTIYAGGSRGLYALPPDGTPAWLYNSVYPSSAYPIPFVLIDDRGDAWCDATSTLPNSGDVVRVNPNGQERGAVGLTSRVTQIAEAPDGSIVATGRFIDIDGNVATLKPWIVGGYFSSFGVHGTPYSTGSDLTAYGADQNTRWTVINSSNGVPVATGDGTIYVASLGAFLAVNADGPGSALANCTLVRSS